MTSTSLSKSDFAADSPSPAAPTADRRHDIDGLRAVALLGVVFYHAVFYRTRGFFIGVDMFFVISGYFITLGLLKDLERGSFTLGGFYARRAWRIIPPLAGMALCCVIPAYFWYPPLEFIQFGKTLASVLAFFSNLFFYSQGGYFDAAVENSPFLHTWFLSVQVQFYILFPFFFRFIHRRFPGKIVVIITAALLGSLALSQLSVVYFSRGAYYLLFSRLWELLTGSLVAILSHRGIPRTGTLSGWRAEGLGWIAVLSIAIPGLAYSPETPFPGLAAFPVCLGTAILIALPQVSRRRPSISALLSVRPAVFVGRISYSVYLWHWPIFVYLKSGLMVDQLTRDTKFLAILISLGAGFVAWAILERGLGNAKRLGARLRIAIMLIPLALAMILLGALYGTSGLPQRFPPEAQPYIQALEDSQAFNASALPCQINDPTPEAVERVRRGDLCVFGDAADPGPLFLAWGDSHINHLIPLLDDIAGDLSIQGLLLTTPARPPLLDVYHDRSDSPSQKRDYMALTRAAVEMIREKEIPVVLLASFWPGSFLRDLTARREDGTVLVRFDAILQGLRNTLSALSEAGCEVWLVQTVPFYPVSVPRLMIRETTAGRDPRRFYLRFADYEKNNAEAKAILDTVAKEFPNVRVIEPGSVLCSDGEVCLPVIDNQPLYFDDNHLSAFGAHLLKPAFAGFVDSLERFKK